MDFQSNYNRTWHSKPEVNDGPILVEAEGYMTTEELISQFLVEGLELQAAREEMHDFKDEQSVVLDQPLDPTRNLGFDMAEATELAMGIKPVETTEEPAETVVTEDKPADGEKVVEGQA